MCRTLKYVVGKKKLIQTATYLPPEMHKALGELAEKEERSISQMIFIFIREGLERREKEKQ